MTTHIASTDEQQIRDLLDAYETALNTSDADAAVAVYATDGAFYPYNLPTAAGSDDLLASYRQIFETIELDITFEVHEVVISGSVAFATTTSRGHVTVREPGLTLAEENREIFVFAVSDGAWKIARYMFNKSADLAAPGA